MVIQKTHVAKPMDYNNGFYSHVDIIVPFYGQYDKVIKLTESILRFTISNVYQLCLVDDCSPNSDFIETHLSEVKINNLKLIRNQTQLGFGGAMKAGFDQTSNPWVVFMNSDCEVTDVNWLKSLGECLLKMKSKGVRMVAPRTNNPLIDSAELLGEKGRVYDDVVFTGDYMPMYCFMVHRELFSRVGGFIKAYPYGGYEDLEFATRLNAHGYKQGVAGKSWVYHEGGATITELKRKKPQSAKVMDIDNQERYVEDVKAQTKFVPQP